MSASQKLDQMIARFYMSDPIILNVLSMFDKVPDPKQETIGVDIRGHRPKITYNPNFVNTISPEVLETVLVMEGLKILLGHPTTRLKEPKHITSMASDLAVTELQKDHFNNILGDYGTMAKDLGLPEKEIFEEYWRLLNQIQEQFNQFVKDNFSIQQNDGDTEEQEGQGQGQGGDTEEQEGQGQGQGGDTEEQEGQGQSGGSGFKEFENQDQAMKEYFNPNGTNTQGWDANEFMEAAIKNMVNDAKDKVRQWGKYTGSCVSEILAANKPKINFKMLLRNFARSITNESVTTSRMKINRRYDLNSPGRRYDRKCHVLVAIDSSGSMSDSDLARGLSIVNSVFNYGKVSYVVFDTEVKNFDTNYKKAKKSVKMEGRGGTDCRKMLDWAIERNKKDKFDGMIMFSDFYLEEVKKPDRIPFPVVGLCTNNGAKQNPLPWLKNWIKMTEE